jgi:hypothetical protein
MSSSLIKSFWLGKALQLEDISSITARKEEIKATLNNWQSCLSSRVKQLLLLEGNNSLDKLDSNIPIENGLFKEDAFIGLRSST